MRRPVSERDAVRSQVIDVLEAQEIKETGYEEKPYPMKKQKNRLDSDRPSHGRHPHNKSG
jgi:hypothetical protein